MNAFAAAVAPLAGAAHIHFDSIEKTYASSAGSVKALEPTSFTVLKGEVFGVIGRSGAGKSTLLRAINMLERPTGGKVWIDGEEISAKSESDLVLLRRRIGMIFQHFNLMTSRTVRANIGLPLKVAGVRPAVIHARVEEVLHLVGLSDKADAYPAQLSGGQQQRVGIARALVHEPEILLCDEATSALDPETTESILSLLQDINRKLGLTIVLITHDMGVIRSVCDRVLVLDQGRVAEIGPVWQVFGSPQSAATRALLRPLQRDIPPDLEGVLTPELAPEQAGHVILRVQYNSNGQADAKRNGLALQTLQVLGAEAQLLHGGIERLHGRSHGRLLVALPSQLGRVLDLLKLQQQLSASDVRIIGYVPEHV